jgi:hypothetical protein
LEEGGGLLFFFSFFLLSLCCTVVFALLVSGSTVYSKISSNFGIMYLPFYKQCPTVSQENHKIMEEILFTHGTIQLF